MLFSLVLIFSFCWKFVESSKADKKNSTIDKWGLFGPTDTPWWLECISIEIHSVAICSRSNCIGPVLFYHIDSPVFRQHRRNDIPVDRQHRRDDRQHFRCRCSVDVAAVLSVLSIQRTDVTFGWHWTGLNHSRHITVLIAHAPNFINFQFTSFPCFAGPWEPEALTHQL